jgi:hypothetical protein
MRKVTPALILESMAGQRDRSGFSSFLRGWGEWRTRCRATVSMLAWREEEEGVREEGRILLFI